MPRGDVYDEQFELRLARVVLAMKDVVPCAQQPSLSSLKTGMDRIWTRSLACRSEALNFTSSASVEMKGQTTEVQALAGSCRVHVMYDLILGLYEQAGSC